MPSPYYIVRNTEKTQPSARQKELEALLYLFSVSEDKDEMEYYVVDVFNDLTGVDNYFNKGWDFQSKAEKGESPNQIGVNLLTLFKNYLSGFPFCEYTLFFGGASSSTLVRSDLEEYTYENIVKEKLDIICEALRGVAVEKGYIQDDEEGVLTVREFIKTVRFVQPKKNACDYIKEYLSSLSKSVLTDEVCAGICKKIKAAQQGLKDETLEGKVLKQMNDVACHGHHLSKADIKNMILASVLSCEVFKYKAKSPSLFDEWSSSTPLEARRDAFLSAQGELAKAYMASDFDSEFWRVFKGICEIFERERDISVMDLKNNLALLRGHPFLTLPSLMLLAGFIKEEFYEN